MKSTGPARSELREKIEKNNKQQAASNKPQATSSKHQSSSSIKRQAASPEQQASSSKPCSNKSKTLEPLYKKISSLSFSHLGTSGETMINEFSGCFTWNDIWCGESLTFLPLVTFNSTVKKVLFLLYPNRSGVPKELKFSSLVQLILGVDFLNFCHNLDSGFKVITAFSKLVPYVLFHPQL